jgi:SAM-dependent methyltransferase
MARIAPFEAHPGRYDSWFQRHRAAYQSELLAVRALLPRGGRGVEIGVGTGRFATPLGICWGLDPSPAMQRYAARRGVNVTSGTAESLPFEEGSFDTVLSVTTICFVDDVQRMLAEARRVLRPGGRLVPAFVDRDCPHAEEYLCGQLDNAFYREAIFRSAPEVNGFLAASGFRDAIWVQTLWRPLEDVQEIEPIRSGHGDGLFVVVRAERP